MESFALDFAESVKLELPPVPDDLGDIFPHDFSLSSWKDIQQQSHDYGYASPSKKRKRVLSSPFSDIESPSLEGNKSSSPSEDTTIEEKTLTPYQRKERRKIRNRISAQLHRQRQRDHVEHLEQQLVAKNIEIMQLRSDLDAITRAHNSSLQRLHALEEEAAAAAALNVAVDLEMYANLEKVNFFGDNQPEADEGRTDAEQSGTMSESDSPYSDLDEGAHVQQQTRHEGIQRLCSFDNLLTTNLDELELDLGVFDDNRTQSRLNTRDEIENPPANQAFGRQILPTGRSAASITAFGLLFMFTMFSKVPNPASIGTHLLRAARFGNTAGHSAPRGRVLRAIDYELSDVDISTKIDDELTKSDSYSISNAFRTVFYEDDVKLRSMKPGWLFSPNEGVPATWRSSTARRGLTPWIYKRALDLFGLDDIPWTGLPVVLRNDVEAIHPNDIPGNYFDVDMYNGGKDVDIYRGGLYEDNSPGNVHSRAVAMEKARPEDKSYMFCPASHGMMSPRMITHVARALPVALKKTTDHSNSLVVQHLHKEKVSVNHQNVNGQEAPDQFLTLLVPSSSLDWGRLPLGLNVTAAEHGEGWLEIGCQIINTRLVQDVSFTV